MKTRRSIGDTHLLDEFRDRLAAARLHLARMVATTDEDLETLAARESRETAEDAAVGTVSDLLARLEGQERHELDEIDAAQVRLEAGVFGVCEGCHQAIALGRLRAMPAARLCTICQDRTETTKEAAQ